MWMYIYIFSILVYIFLSYKPFLESSLEAKVLGKVASLVIEDQVTENVRTSKNVQKKIHPKDKRLDPDQWFRVNEPVVRKKCVGPQNDARPLRGLDP